MNKANLKLLGLYEILLGTRFDRWIPVLGAPRGCPALERFLFFYFDPPSEHSSEHCTKSFTETGVLVKHLQTHTNQFSNNQIQTLKADIRVVYSNPERLKTASGG